MKRVFFLRWAVPAVFLLVLLFWFLLAKDNYFHWDEWEYFINYKDLLHYILHLTNEQVPIIYFLYSSTLFYVFGLNYIPFQLANSTLHAINSLLLYKIISIETNNRRLAVLAMIIFGFSSVSVENLVYAGAATQVLAGFLFFLAYLLFLQYIYTKEKQAGLVLMSAFLLISSPLSHAMTLLGPFALAFLIYMRNLPNEKKIYSSVIYILAGIINLIIFLIFSQGRLTENVKYDYKYILGSVPVFVLDGVFVGNIVRLFIPQLYVFPKWLIFDFHLRSIIRNITILIPIPLFLFLIYKLSRFKRRTKEIILQNLTQYLPLICIFYLAAAPSRASFGFGQAVITRYTYESFFFILVLGTLILKQLNLNRALINIVFLYLLIIHIFAAMNFENNYWRPIVNKEKLFVEDVVYLFNKNQIVYDLSARGIFPIVTLSKLWFLYPKNHQLSFKPASEFPIDLSLASSDKRSQGIYQRILTSYDFKTY